MEYRGDATGEPNTQTVWSSITDPNVGNHGDIIFDYHDQAANLAQSFIQKD